MVIQDSAEVQFSPVLTHNLVSDDDSQPRRLDEGNGHGTIVVVCSVTFTSDVHEGRCALPSFDKIPLAGSFRLSVSLPSTGELVGGSGYDIEVTACPEEWFFHTPSGRCKACDTSMSVCNGGKELPIPKRGFWSDLDNAELGFVCATTFDHSPLVGAVTDLSPIKRIRSVTRRTHAQVHVQLRQLSGGGAL